MEAYSIPEGMDTVTLPLDDGTDLVCDVVMMFTVDDQEYIALLPPDGYDEEGTVYLYRYFDAEQEEDIVVESIDSDEEWEKVADAYDEILDSEEFKAYMELDELLDD